MSIKLNRINRIITLIPNRFPTEKAYGVTVSETMNASLSLGYSSEVWCTSDEILFKNNFLVKKILPNFRTSQYPLLEKLLFQWSRFLFLVKSIRSLPDCDSIVIWTRDPIISVCVAIARRNLNICLELHHAPTPTDKAIFVSLTQLITLKPEKFKIFTLTDRLSEELSPTFSMYHSGLIHMAAPPEFFNVNKDETNKNQIVLGYVGKAFSSGNSNQLEKFLQLFQSVEDSFPNLKLELIGIESEHIPNLLSTIDDKLVRSGRIEIVGHLSRAHVQARLQKIDIGVVPYTSSKYNDFRFPIKIVEYAASGCALLLCDTENLKSLVGNHGTYFKHEDRISFCRALSDLIENRGKLRSAQQLARIWANDFTYLRRVNVVLEAFL